MKLQLCADCHKPAKDYLENGLCEACKKKKDQIPSKFDSQNWIRYLHKLKDQEWSVKQLNCPEHYFLRIPKSGKHLGIPLWRCIYCEGVTQAS